MMDEQDERLDLLSTSIHRQKELGVAIGREAEEQTLLLNDLDKVCGFLLKRRELIILLEEYRLRQGT